MFIPTYGILFRIRFVVMITKYTVLDEQRREAKGAFTNPPGPVRFSNPAACRRISRPCGTLPNFISTAFMVTYPTEPGRCPVHI